MGSTTELVDTWEPSWPGRPPGPGSLGQRIARLRAGRGWTQQHLADRLGISRVAVSHLETDLNTPSERTVALLASCFRMEPHDLVAATSYPVAKSDRLPLVVTRWTEVEHQLALLERDLWWLDGGPGADAHAEADAVVAAHAEAGRAGPGAATVERVLATWEAELAKLAGQVLDPADSTLLADARRAVADRRRAARP